MAFYNYRCKVCKIKDVIEKESTLFEERRFYFYGDCDHEDCDLVWEERHSINADPIIKCPLCDEIVQKTMIGVNTSFYFKGNCYLDKAGAQRDMNLYKLQKDDPYKSMRQVGEADHLAQRLKNAGKIGYNKSGNRTTQYYNT